jgi:ubiquitin-protein ligase
MQNERAEAMQIFLFSTFVDLLAPYKKYDSVVTSDLLPQTVPYKYGSYKVHITIPVDYPWKPPEIKLLTYIYHPAVMSYIGSPTFCRACCSKQWSPAYRIDQLIEILVFAIDHPEDDGAYCVMDRAPKTLFHRNRVQYEEKALEMVKNYSCPRPNPSIISLKFAVKQMICKQLYFDSEKLDQLPLSNRLKQYLHS